MKYFLMIILIFMFNINFSYADCCVAVAPGQPCSSPPPCETPESRVEDAIKSGDYSKLEKGDWELLDWTKADYTKIKTEDLRKAYPNFPYDTPGDFDFYSYQQSGKFFTDLTLEERSDLIGMEHHLAIDEFTPTQLMEHVKALVEHGRADERDKSKDTIALFKVFEQEYIDSIEKDKFPDPSEKHETVADIAKTYGVNLDSLRGEKMKPIRPGVYLIDGKNGELQIDTTNLGENVKVVKLANGDFEIYLGEAAKGEISGGGEIKPIDDGYSFNNFGKLNFSNEYLQFLAVGGKFGDVTSSGYSFSSIDKIIDGNLSLEDAINLRRMYGIITADTIGAGSMLHSVAGVGFNSSFSNVSSAYFFESGFAFSEVETLIITKVSGDGSRLTYIIADAGNTTFNESGITIDHAASVIIGDRIISTDSYGVFIPFTYGYDLFEFEVVLTDYEELRVDKSHMLMVGNRAFVNLSDSEMVIVDCRSSKNHGVCDGSDEQSNSPKGVVIVYANLSTYSDEITYELDNSIFEENGNVLITLDQNERVEYVNFNGSLFLKTPDVLRATLGFAYVSGYDDSIIDYYSFGQETLVGVMDDWVSIRAYDDMLMVYNGSRLIDVIDGLRMFSNSSGGFIRYRVSGLVGDGVQGAGGFGSGANGSGDVGIRVIRLIESVGYEYGFNEAYLSGFDGKVLIEGNGYSRGSGNLDVLVTHNDSIDVVVYEQVISLFLVGGKVGINTGGVIEENLAVINNNAGRRSDFVCPTA